MRYKNAGFSLVLFIFYRIYIKLKTLLWKSWKGWRHVTAIDPPACKLAYYSNNEQRYGCVVIPQTLQTMDSGMTSHVVHRACKLCCVIKGRWCTNLRTAGSGINNTCTGYKLMDNLLLLRTFHYTNATRRIQCNKNRKIKLQIGKWM